jgi:hypothetical protein
MSANALAITVLFTLVLTAGAVRVAIGPIAGVAGADGSYTLAKIGSVSEAMAERVQLARSDVRAGN